MENTFYLVRVNYDPFDVFAALTLQDAVEAAQPDPRAVLEWAEVQAPNAGAARLREPELWQEIRETLVFV